MPDIIRSRWLSAILLILTTPASSQSVLSYIPANGTTGTTDNDALTNRSNVSLSHVSYEELGQLMMFRRRYQAAIETFKKIQFPSASVWNQVGIAYQMLYDYKDALRCYGQALRLNPHDPIVIGNLATAQDGLGDFGGAEKNYRKSLKLSPNSALVLKNLGTNLLMQHKYIAGAAAYKQALAIDAHIFENRLGFKMNTPAPTAERGTAAYFKAKSCARAGLNDCAIAFLREALDEGLTPKQLDEEQDFAALRNTAAYNNLITAEQ